VAHVPVDGDREQGRPEVLDLELHTGREFYLLLIILNELADLNQSLPLVRLGNRAMTSSYPASSTCRCSRRHGPLQQPDEAIGVYFTPVYLLLKWPFTLDIVGGEKWPNRLN
jgi:hypothetical protein